MDVVPEAACPCGHPQKPCGCKEALQIGEPCSHPYRSVFAVWKGIIEGTAYTGQARVTASESYRSLAAEATKSSRLSKERMLKKVWGEDTSHRVE